MLLYRTDRKLLAVIEAELSSRQSVAQ